MSRIEKLLGLLENPQEGKGINMIHIGGTNGKGSVCAMISSILKEAGYKVGTFTSPHLSRFSERIKINDKEISREDILDLTEKIKKHCDEMAKSSKENHPTFFEFITAMAFTYFKKNNVDFAVMEVGLGGRLDSTNVINPLVSVVTNVTRDHSHILGNSLSDIAKEKAGIIKKGSEFITASDDPEVLLIFEKNCKEKNVKIHNVNDFVVKQKDISLDGQRFDVKTNLKEHKNLLIKLLGQHQITNAITAVAITETLSKRFDINEEAMRAGLLKAKWPGRLEVVNKKPLIIFDSAHNPHAIEKLKQTLMSDPFKHDKMILVLAISSNKEIEKIVNTITSIADVVIITKHDVMDRSANQYEIKKYVKEPKNTIIKDTVKEALKEAQRLAKENDMICVTGSIFTIGDARDFWFDQKPEMTRLGM